MLRHATWPRREFGSACFVQRKIPESGDALVWRTDTRISPCQREHIGRLGHDFSAKRTDEATRSKFRVDHRRSSKSDSEPVDPRNPVRTGVSISLKRRDAEADKLPERSDHRQEEAASRSGDGFVADSPLEEAVTSEPVSARGSLVTG
jgi:hypothetical protein